ncbi:MAG TPA: XdhC family protein [Pseudonocardiaceae bacterium]|jgi:xanthine/CO dehydrogenase XdhC/CoxF family maturation factor|nr:XdhC family protein [Pseudonocardiaceae bacterium]
MTEQGPATHIEDPSCAVAHGAVPPPVRERTLVAVFASPVARYLLQYGQDLGFHPILVEPDADRRAAFCQGQSPFRDAEFLKAVPELDGSADLVATDHHRPELGLQLRDALRTEARWIGVLGNPRHPGPHIEMLRELGVADPEVARVHRPVGLNIGSRTPPEIAIATLAGLLADRNDRPGGFEF